MSMHSRWGRLWAGLGGAPPSAAWSDLLRRYRGPGRHYHTLRHLRACFRHLDRSPAPPGGKAAVELALWYHDAVYDPRASDNEARSAALLRASAPAGVDPAVVEQAARLVMATAQAVPAPVEGVPAPVEGAAALVRDIDLAILGAPWWRFALYERRVRQEYAFLADDDWRMGRTRILEGFLAGKRIYQTPRFFAVREKRARRNLLRSVRRLRTGKSGPRATPAAPTRGQG